MVGGVCLGAARATHLPGSDQPPKAAIREQCRAISDTLDPLGSPNTLTSQNETRANCHGKIAPAAMLPLFRVMLALPYLKSFPFSYWHAIDCCSGSGVNLQGENASNLQRRALSPSAC